jgi:hypothetical protein
MSARRGWAATGVGLLVISLYIAVVGVLDSTGQYVNDKAVGYGVAVFVAAAAGSWLFLTFGRPGDGPR